MQPGFRPKRLQPRPPSGQLLAGGLIGCYHERWSAPIGFSPALSRVSHAMLPIHAVGIDLGTTYSCLAYLNEHGEPITIPNRDGELSTPSAVWFDGEQVI